MPQPPGPLGSMRSPGKQHRGSGTGPFSPPAPTNMGPRETQAAGRLRLAEQAGWRGYSPAAKEGSSGLNSGQESEAGGRTSVEAPPQGAVSCGVDVLGPGHAAEGVVVRRPRGGRDVI